MENNGKNISEFFCADIADSQIIQRIVPVVSALERYRHIWYSVWKVLVPVTVFSMHSVSGDTMSYKILFRSFYSHERVVSFFEESTYIAHTSARHIAEDVFVI